MSRPDPHAAADQGVALRLDSSRRPVPDSPSSTARVALARYCAAVALVALVVGGVAMSLSSLSGAPLEQVLAAAGAHPGLHGGAAVALALISLADLGTIMALHDHLQRYGSLLVLVAAGSAVLGDLLNIAGRLAQVAIVPVAGSNATERAPSAALTLDALERTFNTAGFLLVAVAFAAFGVLFLRAGRRALGMIAIVAAGCTAVGQVPMAEYVFYVANIAFLLWYAALTRLFRRGAPGAEGATGASTGRTTPDRPHLQS